MEKISTDKLRFVDEYGRERIFTGMNVVDKKDFDIDNPGFGYPADTFPFEEYKARGFDMIRLGFTWSAMEPAPGHYNEKLIESLKAFLDKCEEYGIYAFLDCHQDLYSSYCYGDGAPRWATITDEFTPHKQLAVWAEGYFYGRACHRAFDNFWNNVEYNKKGLQDYFADMWKHLATELGGHPALFGYDFLNEPFPGADGGKIFRKLIANVVKTSVIDKRVSLSQMAKEALGPDKPKALDQFPAEVFKKVGSVCDDLVKKFDEEKYSPFISKMGNAVREIRDDGILFVDNNYYSNLGIPCCNKAIEVNGKKDSLQCFAPHAYDLMVDTPAYKYANNSRVGMIFDEHRKTQERLGVPCIIGEWGSSAEGDGWYPHFRFLLKKFDNYKWSNTYWCYYDGILEKDFMCLLTRPHPKAVAGEIKEYEYDCENGVFTLTFEQKEKCKKPTVIYIDRDAESIETNGKVKVVKHKVDIGSDIEIKTEPGINTVKITF